MSIYRCILKAQTEKSSKSIQIQIMLKASLY